MSNVSECPYAMSTEVMNQCVVKKGCDHGPAPLPEEGKWIQAKQITDISAYTHGVGWCAPQQGACKLSLNVKNGIIEEALVETIGCSGMTHSAAMAAEILPGKTLLEALNTDLVCDAINTAMRELFLQIVSVEIKSERTTVFGDVVIRVSDKFAPAMHIDTDEANAACAFGNITGTVIA